METQDIIKSLQQNPAIKDLAQFQELEHAKRGVHLEISCAPSSVVDVAKALDEAGFLIECIAGLDWLAENAMEVVYDFNRMTPTCRVAVRVRLPRDQAELPTISEVFGGANWHERETHEMFGIRFTGHPNLTPLLLPEDATFHPLRKDYNA